VEQVVELGIVIVALLPFLRLMSCPPFLRRLGTAPGPAVAGGGALIGVIGISSWAAISEPWLLRAVAAGSLVALTVTWWRARPSFGHSRGLPPGSLAVASLGPWTDPDFYAKQAARHGPIFKTSSLVTPAPLLRRGSQRARIRPSRPHLPVSRSHQGVAVPGACGERCGRGDRAIRQDPRIR